MGEPIDWLWRDRESFADLITRYDTDREPESILLGRVLIDIVRDRGAPRARLLRSLRPGPARRSAPRASAPERAGACTCSG